MKDISASELHSRGAAILRDAQHEVQVERDEDGIVLAIGFEGDSEIPEDVFDEGPIVDYPTVSLPEGQAVEHGYFASR